MIKQMKFNSQTSQYGQMSRGVKFRRVAKEVEKIQREILQEIEEGRFAKEWKKDESKVKLQVMRFFESNTKFAEREREVRENLGFKKLSVVKRPTMPTESELNEYPGLKEEIKGIRTFYEGL